MYLAAVDALSADAFRRGVKLAARAPEIAADQATKHDSPYCSSADWIGSSVCLHLQALPSHESGPPLRHPQMLQKGRNCLGFRILVAIFGMAGPSLCRLGVDLVHYAHKSAFRRLPVFHFSCRFVVQKMCAQIVSREAVDETESANTICVVIPTLSREVQLELSRCHRFDCGARHSWGLLLLEGR